LVYIGLDEGTKTVGVAVSDRKGSYALPLETIVRKEDNKLRRTYARIEELVRENGAEAIVVGLPRNMDGTEGFRAAACRKFAEDVARRTGLPVTMWDERLSTVEAEESLIRGGVKRKDHKAVIDQLAASVILQDFLDENNRRNKHV
jgi:putative Holliday junction resolvase